jgi:hypothetical protein
MLALEVVGEMLRQPIQIRQLEMMSTFQFVDSMRLRREVCF